MRSTRYIPLALLAALAVLALAPATASAATATFRNSAPITVPDQGPASPSPSTVNVRDLRGPIVDIEVQLRGVTHTRPRDLDILLLAPDATGAILISDACGTGSVSSQTWTIKSTNRPPRMPEGGACPDSTYGETNYGEDTDFPGVTRGPMSGFHHKAMNGQWRLYVRDDEGGNFGQLAQGWSLTLTTADVDAFVPGLGTSGPANRYPTTRTIAGNGEVITDLDVFVPDISHDRPDDLDLLLVGPNGQTTMLMSDACGDSLVENLFIFDDEATRNLPDGTDPAACGGAVRASDFEGGERLPEPAPGGLHGNSLEIYDFTDPAGEWRLYAADDSEGGEGYLARPFDLTIQTRPKAKVELSESSVSVAEGSARNVTVTRSVAGSLGEGTVEVRSAPGSASSGDFMPVVQTVRFGYGEREKTVRLDARADGAAEGPESYTVALSDPTGDAALGARARLTATIPASAGPAGQGGGAGENAVRCGGRRATIVGTAGRDRLRGTRRRDVIAGLGGNDRITAGRGNDIVCGGSGRDRVSGGRGNDRIAGEAGNDRLAGDAGRDRLNGGRGRDRLSGGRGRDRCVGGPGRDRASCERKRSI